jgi:hypothetical protein
MKSKKSGSSENSGTPIIWLGIIVVGLVLYYMSSFSLKPEPIAAAPRAASPAAKPVIGKAPLPKAPAPALKKGATPPMPGTSNSATTSSAASPEKPRPVSHELSPINPLDNSKTLLNPNDLKKHYSIKDLSPSKTPKGPTAPLAPPKPDPHFINEHRLADGSVVFSPSGTPSQTGIGRASNPLGGTADNGDLPFRKAINPASQPKDKTVSPRQ